MQRSRFGAGGRRQWIQLIRLITGGHSLHRAVNQTYLRRECIAKKPGTAQRHINPWPPQNFNWYDFKTSHPAAGPVPAWLHPHKRQCLGNIIPAGAHIRRAPCRQHHRPRPVAMVKNITVKQRICRRPAKTPGDRCRQGMAINGKEITSGRQHFGPPPCRRTRRPRRNKCPGKPGAQRQHLACPTLRQPDLHQRQAFRQNFCRFRAGRCKRLLMPRCRHHLMRQRVKPFDRITGAAPCSCTHFGQYSRTRPVPYRSRDCGQWVKIIIGTRHQTEISRQRPQKRRVFARTITARRAQHLRQ